MSRLILVLKLINDNLGSIVTNLIRLFRTISYLKFGQIFYQIYYRFKKVKVNEVEGNVKASWSKSWPMFSWPDSSMDEEGNFSFLGELGRVENSEDWNSSDKSKIWIYNLHYFDDLNSANSAYRAGHQAELIERWIRDNPPISGNGWEPYCLSLRIVNWIKWASRQDFLPQGMLSSLSQQAEALMAQIELHILGNHLFANAKALTFAGSYFSGKYAEKWLQAGLKILDQEIHEQFLSDGGHFELSPMYHGTVLWDVCDLVQLARTSRHPLLIRRQETWRKVILQGVAWMKSMIHPDGEISFFNDATFGIAPTMSNLLKYAKELGIVDRRKVVKSNITWLKESGYIAIELGNDSKAILDVGCVGADYQPGHAHADTLSFELSLYGRRILVNSGVSQYGSDIERHRQRGTAAHNTVVVDEENSSEVWSGFRVARRARPFGISVVESDRTAIVECSHDGYRRLKGRPVHYRKWNFTDSLLVVEDRVFGDYKEAIAYYHFHPDILIDSGNDGSYFLRFSGDKEAHLYLEGDEDSELFSTTWHPGFGKSIPNTCLAVKLGKQALKLFIQW